MEENWVNGTFLEPIIVKTWHTPKQFYKLTQITIYSDYAQITGFEVTFSPDSDLVNWPIETHLYGEKFYHSRTDIINFDTEIVELEICIDNRFILDGHYDVEGFRFLE